MKVLLLGIGNILFGDEGIGVHLSNLLKLNYKFSSTKHSLDIVDGGTLAQSLIPLITSYDYVILLDCINADDGNIGDVFCFDFNNVPLNINWQGTAHEVEMLQTLKMIEFLGDLPTIKIIATVPEILDSDTTFQLSNIIKDSALIMRDAVIKNLKEIGFSIEQIDNRDLQEVANYSYKGY
ncbi:HyaD/HybD family hydrogenase maturation endopeptidase [Helicobacter sp. MIT 14-3879]|uniref:HyaD/HybD family hydrogenase maturation endopeptidase n=1 Tax=Helicobacter sp. MIT 14-3879 TaxID=2040649 RepID=UPI000E1E777B|nr:HyaD/HybD family hydrogenase maturation endopeptidase [Helicobacter sp. MIT 14-3879]RDU64112.1 hydrogenase expression/formation protein [Helicobacter sp. MIT 14-3879]